jgi:acetolactate synthase-1/3 small subunit
MVHRGTSARNRQKDDIPWRRVGGAWPLAAFSLNVFRENRMRHLLSALVQNQPGVLAQVAGMLASRGYNIDSLAVGETEHPELSRMTFVVRGDDRTVEQVRKQLEKVVTVVQVLDISSEAFVERDLMLAKVECPPDRRSELKNLIDIFRGKIVDVSRTAIMVEIAGTEEKVQAFIDVLRPYGILELARTGRIALVRTSVDLEEKKKSE